MADEWGNCFPGVNPSEADGLRRQWCLPCRNTDCERSGIKNTKWIKRMNHLEEVVNHQKVAPPDSHPEVRSQDFPSKFVETSDQPAKADWDSPDAASLPTPTEGRAASTFFPPAKNTPYPATGLMVDGSAAPRPKAPSLKRVKDAWDIPEESITVGGTFTFSDKK